MVDLKHSEGINTLFYFNNKKCCDVAVAQIYYPNLNKQDSIKQARGRSHEKGSVQIFMLYDLQFGGGGWKLSKLKQKKIENY